MAVKHTNEDRKAVELTRGWLYVCQDANFGAIHDPPQFYLIQCRSVEMRGFG